MSENAHAAERRADYVRALKEELGEVERAGKTARIKAVKAELERVEGKPARRSATPKD